MYQNSIKKTLNNKKDYQRWELILYLFVDVVLFVLCSTGNQIPLGECYGFPPF